MTESFEVYVNNEMYSIEPLPEHEYKISTSCEYMFTLKLNETGNWVMQSDVIPIDENLVQEIGTAIEQRFLKEDSFNE